MNPTNNCEVIVSNVGIVHRGNNYVKACEVYGKYKRLSDGTQGRCSGESVTLLQNGEVKLEHFGTGQQK